MKYGTFVAAKEMKEGQGGALMPEHLHLFVFSRQELLVT